MVGENLVMTSFPDTHRDLLDAPVATLATIDGQGFPQLTEVWFLYDDDGELRISLNDSRLKTRNLTKRPQCSLFILDLANPYRYLDLRGRPGSSPTTTTRSLDRFGAKYGGADLRDHDGPGEQRVAVTVEPVMSTQSTWPPASPSEPHRPVAAEVRQAACCSSSAEAVAGGRQPIAGAMSRAIVSSIWALYVDAELVGNGEQHACRPACTAASRLSPSATTSGSPV